MEKKRALRSKTINLNLLLLGLSFWPKAAQFVALHPQEIIGGIAFVNIVLRMFTSYQIAMPKLPKRTIKTISVLAFVLFILGCAKPLIVDDDKSPLLSGDQTAIIDCGSGHAQVGFCYMRIAEGSTSDRFLFLYGPPSQCGIGDSCVFFKIWNMSGDLIWGTALAPGQTKIGVPWAVLLGSDRFEMGHRGFWTINQEVVWVDKDGNTRHSITQADLVLRVYSRDYHPLDQVQKDEAFIWEWRQDKQVFRMTSSLRAYVGISQ